MTSLVHAAPLVAALVSVTGLPAALHIGRRLERRRTAAAHVPAHAEPKKSTASRRWVGLGIALAAAIDYAVIFAGSARSLRGFGQRVLHLQHGAEWTVPISLDATAVMAAFLTVHARMQDKPKVVPGAYPLVWVTAGFSAFINFSQGDQDAATGGTTNAGLYYAILSVVGIWMFHVLAHQVGQHEVAAARRRPPFGIRWATATYSTTCAALAWINHPPAEDISVTVRAALAHLDDVRATKRRHRQDAARQRAEDKAFGELVGQEARRNAQKKLRALNAAEDPAPSPAAPEPAPAPQQPAPASSTGRRTTRPAADPADDKTARDAALLAAYHQYMADHGGKKPTWAELAEITGDDRHPSNIGRTVNAALKAAAADPADDELAVA